MAASDTSASRVHISHPKSHSRLERDAKAHADPRLQKKERTGVFEFCFPFEHVEERADEERRYNVAE